MEQCQLKMSLEHIAQETLSTDQDQLNAISLLLGRIINAVYTDHQREQRWGSLSHAVGMWYDALPTRFQPFSRAEGCGILPSIWMFQDCHGSLTQSSLFCSGLIHAASAMHYYHVAMSLLSLHASYPNRSHGTTSPPLDTQVGSTRTVADSLDHRALEICSIAFTNGSSPVIVNAFGPIAFCERLRRSFSSPTGPLTLYRLQIPAITGLP